MRFDRQDRREVEGLPVDEAVIRFRRYLDSDPVSEISGQLVSGKRGLEGIVLIFCVGWTDLERAVDSDDLIRRLQPRIDETINGRDHGRHFNALMVLLRFRFELAKRKMIKYRT
jgi:hypothetical protein